MHQTCYPANSQVETQTNGPNLIIFSAELNILTQVEYIHVITTLPQDSTVVRISEIHPVAICECRVNSIPAMTEQLQNIVLHTVLHIYNLYANICITIQLQILTSAVFSRLCLQCFDTVGRATGRASGLQKLIVGLLVFDCSYSPENSPDEASPQWLGLQGLRTVRVLR